MSIASQNHKPIIESREGYVVYLQIVDDYSRQVWIYPTKTKEPPIITVDLFLQWFGLQDGTHHYIRTDQGGELARSAPYHTIVAKHGYIVESTALTPHLRMAGGNTHTARLPIWYDACYMVPT